MEDYESHIIEEVKQWQKKMQSPPSFFNRLSKKTQTKINSYIPDKIHAAITTAIKQMTRAVIFGTRFTTPTPFQNVSLREAELRVNEKIRFFRNTAAAEGAVTGAGGFLLGLADFPLWLTIKMKLLFDIASLYGYNVKDYKERVYILHIFQLTFSSQQNRNKVFTIISDWKNQQKMLPDDINQFDWRNFQQEYRDYLDIAKLLQLIPGIGAVVGAYVNHRLTQKLGETAMNAYRLRWINRHEESGN